MRKQKSNINQCWVVLALLTNIKYLLLWFFRLFSTWVFFLESYFTITRPLHLTPATHIRKRYKKKTIYSSFFRSKFQCVWCNSQRKRTKKQTQQLYKLLWIILPRFTFFLIAYTSLFFGPSYTCIHTHRTTITPHTGEKSRKKHNKNGAHKRIKFCIYDFVINPQHTMSILLRVCVCVRACVYVVYTVHVIDVAQFSFVIVIHSNTYIGSERTH